MIATKKFSFQMLESWYKQTLCFHRNTQTNNSQFIITTRPRLSIKTVMQNVKGNLSSSSTSAHRFKIFILDPCILVQANPTFTVIPRLITVSLAIQSDLFFRSIDNRFLFTYSRCLSIIPTKSITQRIIAFIYSLNNYVYIL